MSKLSKVEKCIQKGKDEELAKLAQDKDLEVRLAAIAGLGKMSGKDTACNALISMMTDPGPKIRAACAEAMGQLGDDRADTHLRYHLEQEKDPQAAQAMHSALSALHHR